MPARKSVAAGGTVTVEVKVAELEQGLSELREHVSAQFSQIRDHFDEQIGGAREHADDQINDVLKQIDQLTLRVRKVGHDVANVENKEGLRNQVLEVIRGAMESLRDDISELKSESASRSDVVARVGERLEEVASQIDLIRENQTLRKWALTVIVTAATTIAAVIAKALEATGFFNALQRFLFDVVGL